MVSAAFKLLGIKWLRCLKSAPGQVLAIALVLATAVATVVMTSNTRLTLNQSLAYFYQHYRFAHLFAEVESAPLSLLASVRDIEGVSAAEGRLTAWAALDIPGMAAPAVGRVVSVPANGEADVNRLAIVAGDKISAENPNEIVLLASFARAHGLDPGDKLDARVAGRARQFTIAGLALSPEAVFAVGPGQIVPNPRRYGVVWTSRENLGELLGRTGRFNQLVVRLSGDADENAVRNRLDALLGPYGGTASYDRTAQVSHAFIEGQIDQLMAIGLVLPPLFLTVAGFLLYSAMARTLINERRQIGIFKALGLSDATLRWHYLLYGVSIAFAGCLFGIPLGFSLAEILIQVYAGFFHFPRIVGEAHIIAAVAACGSVFLVAFLAVILSLRPLLGLLPAAVMQPVWTSAYSRKWDLPLLGERGRMVVRQVLRHRRWFALTAAAAALSTGLIIATLFSFDALDHMIDVVRKSERQDAMILTPLPVPSSALDRLRAKPGVEQAEGFRKVRAEFVAGERRQTAPLIGLPAEGSLKQLLTPRLEAMPTPGDGVVLTTKLADVLHLEVGEQVTLHLPGGHQRQVQVRGLTQQYFGIEANVALATLNDWLGEKSRISGARLTIAPGAENKFYGALKQLPILTGYIDKQATISAFRETMTRTLTIAVSFFVLFAMLTTIGVIYSNALILLSERRRDLALLGALGRPRGELAFLLLIELVLPTLAALPLGLALGRLFGWLITENLDTVLFRVPLVITWETDLVAVATTFFATLMAALLIIPAAPQYKPATVLDE